MQRYFSEEKKDNKLIINEEDIHHIKNVMRMKKEDEIEVVYDKETYLCSLTENYKEAKIIRKTEEQNNTLNVHLLVPILQEEKMSFIIEKSTELGVKEITPVYMNRCKYKIPKEKEQKKLLRWQKIAKEAAEQSKRLEIPIINNIIKIKDIHIKDVNVLCSTDKENVKSLNKVLNNVNNDDIIQVVFGPEGGFTKDEENLLINKNFTKTTFGSRILRTETVPIYILSIINNMFGSEENDI